MPCSWHSTLSCLSLVLMCIIAYRKNFNMKKFIHLHTYSGYSLMQSIMKIDELVNCAKTLQMSAIALTDKESLAGAILFYKAALEVGIKPIIGCELIIINDDY